MIYKGAFRDINGKLYNVEVNTGSGGSKEITLAGNPFTTAMDSSDKTIYTPAKYQTATVRVITPDYNFDIYSAKAQGTKVLLTDESGNIIWVGYVTPNLYDMGFVEEREEIEIECIDALSTLQYIKYQAEDKEVVSFYDILYKVLTNCNAYSAFISVIISSLLRIIMILFWISYLSVNLTFLIKKRIRKQMKMQLGLCRRYQRKFVSIWG